MGQKLTTETQQRIAQGLVALHGARLCILEGRKALKDISDIPELLQPAIVLAYAVPAYALITWAFGTGELRNEAFKVLAKITKDEFEILGSKG